MTIEITKTIVNSTSRKLSTKWKLEQYQPIIIETMMKENNILQISDLEYGLLEVSDDLYEWLKETKFKYTSDHSSGIFETITFENTEGAVEFKLRFINV